MDWFSWLSKTSLDPSLVYEYGLSLSQNELEHDDIPYFNHEFLQSMGISIAKHRLEILKLARKDKLINTKHPISKIIIAIKRTKTSFSKYLRNWIRREESGLALVPSRTHSHGHSMRWKNSMIKRNKRLVVANNNKQNRAQLLLTNGSPKVYSSSRMDSFSSPKTNGFERDEGKMDGDCDEYWSSAVEEIRWDTMFHNLKPT